jgi:transcriptional regulator with XRE-family HTH domain
MAHPPRNLKPYESVRDFFGAELRLFRERAGLSQDKLGKLVSYSGDQVAAIEKAQRWPNVALVRALDDVLDTGGTLSRLFPLLEAQRDIESSSTARKEIDLATVEADHPSAQFNSATSVHPQGVAIALPALAGSQHTHGEDYSLERRIAMAARRALRFSVEAGGSNVGAGTIEQLREEVRTLATAYQSSLFPTSSLTC